MTHAQRFHLMTAPVGNGFNGEIRAVQLSIADNPNHSGHLVKPEGAINAATGRQ
jgi:hypothetical protein